MIILIFKTTLISEKDVTRIADGLTQLVGINNWSVDTGDEDKVLRVQALRDITKELTHLLMKSGYTCETLK
ncbi:hypothetical protein [Ohtaekwangia sp.]|uniref:hypothetical protein n=1 Tax=Ohtaekwangia sp. TaxID=2066019 RepID=UPI002F95E5F8